MSNYKDVCRTCLMSGGKMHDLRSTPLQGIFEKFTGLELVPADGRSRICFLCSAQLLRCCRYLEMVQRADKEFHKFLALQNTLPPPSLAALRGSSFITTPVDLTSLPEHGLGAAVKVELTEVKVEPCSDDVKVEEEDYITDAHFTPEECNMAAESAPTSHRCNNDERFHSKRIIFNCSPCHKDFSTLKLFQRHMKTHEISSCDTCGATCPHSKMESHMRKHTKPYECHICLKSFSELSSQRKHIASHSRTKSFICSMCNKGFTHKSFLIVHLRSHSGEKPCVCEVCGRKFTQIAHLISHRRTHASRKNKQNKTQKFSCDICIKSYALNSSLKRHLKVHANIKPYECEVCNKCFSVRDTLKAHMRCHTKEKPYICSKCDKAFASRGNYWKHVKTHDDNFKCRD